MPHRQIVLDLETQKTFDEVGGRNFSELGVSVVGTYFYNDDSLKCFEEAEIGNLEEMLSSASRVIGFNIRKFDFPVLQPYCKRIDLKKIPLFDILENLEGLLGHRVSLQSVATATLGIGKSGSGLDAIRYFRAGDWDNLKRYCLDDVKITRDVYEYGKKNGVVYYMSRDGQQKLSVKVDWQDPAPPANLSLF